MRTTAIARKPSDITASTASGLATSDDASAWITLESESSAHAWGVMWATARITGPRSETGQRHPPNMPSTNPTSPPAIAPVGQLGRNVATHDATHPVATPTATTTAATPTGSSQRRPSAAVPTTVTNRAWTTPKLARYTVKPATVCHGAAGVDRNRASTPRSRNEESSDEVARVLMNTNRTIAQ